MTEAKKVLRFAGECQKAKKKEAFSQYFSFDKKYSTCLLPSAGKPGNREPRDRRQREVMNWESQLSINFYLKNKAAVGEGKVVKERKDSSLHSE